MLSYLRLCRFPTVFTALADIAAGFLLTHAALNPASKFGLLLGASACLYLSGMVFNDVFDVKQDSEERPNRPIPSGEISRRNATIFGACLMAGGLAFAYAADLRSLIIASGLAVCILLYDGLMKRTPLGPLFMGACRSLNLILGASTAGIRLAGAFQQPLLWVAICMGIYIAGVTWFAKREAKQNLRLPLLLSLLVINTGLAGLAIWLGDFAVHLGIPLPPGIANSQAVLGIWAVIAITINRRAIAAVIDPSPKKIQPSIGVMLLSVIVLNATFIYFKFGNAGIPFAVGVLLLLLPAIGLRRVIPMT
ncbi:UbiA family prenyltransferase [Thalassoglobus sp.]|uniref:UbiA family prenyltransferase n=1 Tax=Thalassoglobus sp. TaxID=2795869 RepID=UPI003AA7ED10